MSGRPTQLNISTASMRSQSDGFTLANSTQPKSLLPSAAKLWLPANHFGALGGSIRLLAHGRISTLAPGGLPVGTLKLDVRLTASSGVLTNAFSSGEMPLNVVAGQTDTPWIFDVELHTRVIGTKATLFGFGAWRSHAVIGSPAPGAGGAGAHVLPFNSEPAVGAAFDATLAQQIDLIATWSTASASNSITLHNYSAKSAQTTAQRQRQRAPLPFGVGVGGRPRMDLPPLPPTMLGATETLDTDRVGVLPWRYRG